MTLVADRGNVYHVWGIRSVLTFAGNLMCHETGSNSDPEPQMQRMRQNHRGPDGVIPRSNRCVGIA